MSAADDVGERLSRIYVRARAPEIVEKQTFELLKAIIALAYAEGRCAGAESVGGIVGASFDEVVKKLTVPS